MGRVKTFTNGGSLLPGDLNSIEDDYEFAFSTYKTLLVASAYAPAATVAGTYEFMTTGDLWPAGTSMGTGSARSMLVPSFDPAEINANTRTTKYLLKVVLATNTTAPAVNFTFGLYPATGSTGATNQAIITLGTVVAGSTALFTTPAATSVLTGSSGDFTAPASGYYVPGVVVSGSTAALSQVAFTVRLLARQV